MSKINNKLILVSGILAFIFNLFLASSAFAAGGGMVQSGVTFNPDYSTQYQYVQPVVYTPAPIVYNTPTVIPGCEGRNTGYSTITGQSCAGNYVAPAPKPAPVTAVRKTTTTVAKTTSKPVATASDVNPNYGSLTANALFGSNSFMPSGLIQWIVFAILILLIVFLWRYVHGSKEKYMTEPLKHA